MKHILITTIAAVVLVGCGESQQSAPSPEAKPVEPVAEAAKPEPTGVKAPDISIHQAAYDGNIEAVKQHLAAAADVNAKGSYKNGTPLGFAAFNGHKEIVELLIVKGADVNAKSDDNWTPLHNASSKGHKEIAELLIAESANVNAKSEDGDTPLSVAIVDGHNEIAELLIAKGADVNAKMMFGGSHLHIADTKKIVELLIAKGANVNAKDDDGDTPLDWTVDEDHKEIADLLRKHGGKTGAELKAEASVGQITKDFYAKYNIGEEYQISFEKLVEISKGRMTDRIF